MSILFGLYQPDKGEIKIDGKKVIINNPNDANNYNIGMVHQHFKLVENFSVLENVILGVENVNKLNKIDYSSPRKEISRIVSEYKLNLNYSPETAAFKAVTSASPTPRAVKNVPSSSTVNGTATVPSTNFPNISAY